MEISTCILCKDNAGSIERVINSIRPISNEIIIVDDHSADTTKEICTRLGARVYELPFNIIDTGFSVARNWMLDKASRDWILMLDSDELLDDPGKLHDLTRSPGKDVWALPRRKWLSYPTQREEYESYPDWQVRFFRNNQENRFTRLIHTVIKNPNISYAYRGPHIEHLQSEYRDPARCQQRQAIYDFFCAKQGLTNHGGFQTTHG